MGDVHCSNCGEPWDAWGLRHDLPWDYGDWTGYPGQVPLKLWREKAAEDGWVFGNSVLTVLRCACCPKEDQAATDPLKEAAETLLSDDEDALQAIYEDEGL